MERDHHTVFEYGSRTIYHYLNQFMIGMINAGSAECFCQIPGEVIGSN